MRQLDLLAKTCAVLGGALLTVITLMTCVSVIGRNTVGWTIVGDFELTGAVAGAGIALFLPYCQLKRGNIGVDFFTAWASPHARATLDRLGTLLLALAMSFMTWRTAIGGLKAWASKSGSMMLGFPEWVVYAFIVPSLALTAAIAFVQVWQGADAGATAKKAVAQ